MCCVFTLRDFIENISLVFSVIYMKYKCADKSLARPGRKQATATEDFDIPYL